ncbi:MAG: hypothetical protein HY812_10330 [Planctomycetes bacterium]|nr:hypothetical protein [Planctomycetota bacterium]
MRVTTLLPLLAVLLAVTLLASGAAANDAVTVEVLNSSVQHTVIKYTLNDFTTQPVTIAGQRWDSVTLDGEGYLTEVGSPQLPHVCRSVEIPDTAAMRVNVIGSRYHDIQNVLVAPSKGPIPRCIDPARVPFTFGAVYGQDAWYPASPASQRDPYVMRDVRGMVVEANLFQYNPVQQVLRVYDELVLEVVVSGPMGKNPIDRSAMASHPDYNFDLLYNRHFLNHVPQKALNPAGDLLIICYGSFLTNMQPLVNWKNSVGVPTTLVNVSSVGSTAAAIKTYITNLYNTTNLTYVLLVGDIAQMPSFSWSGGASDPTYSTITAGDSYPDIFVGRFSASTTAHVDTQVARTVAYEQAGHTVAMGGWNAKGMGIASNQGPGHYGEYDNAHVDLIRGQLMTYGYTLVDQIYDYSGTKAMVTNGLNNGRRSIHYCGHGSTTSWGSTGFSNSDVYALSNYGMLPTVHSVACVNGDFSYSECFGEAWLRATKSGQAIGAVSAYMSSINQYWNEPMYGQAIHGKTAGKYGAADLFCAETWTSIGALWFGGSCAMMDITGASGKDMFLTWHIFGDPSLCAIGQLSTCPVGVNYGTGEVGSNGKTAHTSHVGAGTQGNPNFYITLTGARPNMFAVLLKGMSQASVPYSWGTVLVGAPSYVRVYTTTNGLGEASLQETITPAMVGQTWYYQFLARDPGYGGDVQAGDGMYITYCP